MISWMDNQQIDVTSEGQDGIVHALEIIWDSAAPGGKATHYKIVKLAKRTRYYARQDAIFPSNIDGLEGYHAHHFSDLQADESGVQTLILFWHDEKGAQKLPFSLNCKQAAKFIADWLSSPDCDWGGQPDHDGDNGRGFRIFTESWGHVAGHSYAIVAAQPAWAMYGK